MPWEKNFNKFGFPAGFNNFDAQRFSSTYYVFFKKSFLRNRCYFYRFGSLKEEVKYEI